MVVATNDSWDKKPAWESEFIPPKKQLMNFIIRRVKAHVSKEELMETEILDFIRENNLPKFKKSEVSKMVDWAIKTFPPDDGMDSSPSEETPKQPKIPEVETKVEPSDPWTLETPKYQPKKD